MRRSSQSHQPAGVSLAHLVFDFHMARDGPKSRRRYQFFESTSFSARLSNVSSATTCFSFRFSSSNCFSFFASPLSIPHTLPSSDSTSAPRSRAGGITPAGYSVSSHSCPHRRKEQKRLCLHGHGISTEVYG